MVGNGKNTFLWLDNWHPLGPLYARFGSRVVYNLGRNLLAKVDTIISAQSWQWPRGRNSVTGEILRATPPHFIPHPSQEDTVIWNLTPNNSFSIKSAWNAVRRQLPKSLGIQLFGLSIMSQTGPSSSGLQTWGGLLQKIGSLLGVWP